MGKKSRLKRERREAAEKGSKAFKLSPINHPLADIPFKERVKAFVDFGKDQGEKFPESIEKLQAVIRKSGPIGTLSVLAYYGVTSGVTDAGEFSQILGDKVLPAHIELMQALYLQVPVSEISTKPPVPNIIQEAFDGVIEASSQFHAKRFTQISKATDNKDRARLAVQESIRSATQMLRNWGYYESVKAIAVELMVPLEGRFETVHGFKSSDLVKIFDQLGVDWQTRASEHFGKVKEIFRAKTIPEVATEYFKAFPDMDGTPEEFVQLMRDRSARLQDVRFMLLAHSDLRLADLFLVDTGSLAGRIGLRAEAVEKALKRLSIDLGGLVGTKIEHYFMANPIWTRPVIGLGEGQYYCPLPQTFFSFWFDVILSLVAENKALLDAYDKRRSDFLEDRVSQIFQKAFPGGTVTKNFKWKSADGSQEFESDLIVSVDSFLLLVEAKSGRVASESRRGAPDNLGQDVNALLVEPSRQSQRLADAIASAKCATPGMDAFGKSFPCDLNKVHRVIRLSVTLEEMGFLQSRVNGLKDAGYVPESLVVAPSVSVADLEVVFDILESVPAKLHYWVRRSELEGLADYMADELDLLGTYLKSGLSLGGAEEGGGITMFLAGESKEIDEYYEANRVGIARPKPTLKLTDWWKAMLQRLEAIKPDRWTELVVILLCASYDQQVEIERRVKGVVADVTKRREKAAKRNALVFVPSPKRGEAIGIVALMGSEMAERHLKMEGTALHAFGESAHVQECAVLMLNVDQPLSPYSTIAWFQRPEEE